MGGTPLVSYQQCLVGLFHGRSKRLTVQESFKPIDDHLVSQRGLHSENMGSIPRYGNTIGMNQNYSQINTTLKPRDISNVVFRNFLDQHI